jgi:Tfp pilus assembly protein PilN
VTGMVGIALAPDALELNITPESVLLRKRLVARSHSLCLCGALLMMLTVSMSLYATLVLYFKHSELEYLQTMRESSDAVVQDVNRKVGIVKTVRNTQEKKFATVNVFSEVHRVRPEKVSVDQLEIDAERNKLMVSGTGTSLGEVRELVNALEGSRLFKNVKPGGTRLGRDGRYSFQVVADMEISK